MTTIEADYQTLMKQSADTVESYLSRAIRMLEERFDSKFVEANPELLGQLVSAMATDFHSGVFGKAVGELADVIREQRFVPDD
jgi:hypothetical protein